MDQLAATILTISWSSLATTLFPVVTRALSRILALGSVVKLSRELAQDISIRVEIWQFVFLLG